MHMSVVWLTSVRLIGYSLQLILGNNQLDALFRVFIYFMSLHVSSVTALIIRRSNCINTSSGMISVCDCLVCRSGGKCSSLLTGIPSSQVGYFQEFVTRSTVKKYTKKKKKRFSAT